MSQKSSASAPKRARAKTKPAQDNQAAQIDEHKKNAKNQPTKGAADIGGSRDVWRYIVVWIIMVSGILWLILRAYYLQVVNSEFYIAKGEEFITGKRKLPVSRGMIYDRFGTPLAANAPLVTVVFSPYSYAQAYYLAKKNTLTKDQNKKQKAEKTLAELDLARLAEASGYPLEKLKQAVQIDDTINVKDDKAVAKALPKGAGSQRLVLLNQVTPETAELVTALKFKGVGEEVHAKRFYLQAEPMAQILGYMAKTGDENAYKGRAGIELQYETALAGTAGEVLVLKNADQYALKQIKEISPEVAGQNIHLTIDSRLQYVLYKALEQVGREQSARWASGMIVEVHTGEVLAMGAWPSFNSNNLADRTGVSERNRAVLDVFEPGSVVKPFTVAAALESGKYNTNTLIETGNGVLGLSGYSIKDGGAYGNITLAELIQKSSNVASAKIAFSLPTDGIADMQRRFGLGQKTPLNFPAEASGLVKNPEQGDMARRATLSYGYGQQVTLAQIAQAYATLGAGGVMYPLKLVKNAPTPPPTEIIKEQHAKDIVRMMELVTMQGGTGKQAAIEGYRVAGKTGTSRRASPKGGYAKGEYRAIFAGVAPASNPKFAVAILVEDPRKEFYAGPVAGPTFSRVMKESLRLYNVPMDKPVENVK